MLCMGKVENEDAFVLFDLVSTHNLVLRDMDPKLDTHFMGMEPKEEAKSSFEGQQVSILLVIGKLQVQVQE